MNDYHHFLALSFLVRVPNFFLALFLATLMDLRDYLATASTMPARCCLYRGSAFFRASILS